MLLNKLRNILAQADSQSLMHSSIESVRQQHLIHQITLCNMEPTIICTDYIEPTFTSEDYIVGHRTHDVITADYMKPTIIL